MEQKKTIKDLKEKLEQIEAVYGLSTTTTTLIEEALRRHRNKIISRENKLKLDYDDGQFKIYKKVMKKLSKEIAEHLGKKEIEDTVLKDFDEIEEEVKNYFSKFDDKDKLKEVTKKLRLKHDNTHDKEKIREYYTDEQIKEQDIYWINLYKFTNSIKIYYGDKYNFYKVKEPLSQLFRIVLGVDIAEDLNKADNIFNGDFFNGVEAEAKGFTFKALKNGYIEIKGDKDKLKKLYNAFKDNEQYKGNVYL